MNMMKNPTIRDASAPSLAAGVEVGRLSHLIGYALRRAQVTVLGDLAETMQAEELRAVQFAVLEVLLASPGMRANQIAAALGIRTTNFVPLFDALERRGLVERRAVTGDRRAKGLFLTEAGAALIDRLATAIAAHEARFTARIGTDGKARLLALLARLVDPAAD